MQKLLLATLLSAPLVTGVAGAAPSGDARADAMQADAEAMGHDMGESQGVVVCARRADVWPVWTKVI